MKDISMNLVKQVLSSDNYLCLFVISILLLGKEEDMDQLVGMKFMILMIQIFILLKNNFIIH